jgi:hypothetical protein
MASMSDGMGAGGTGGELAATVVADMGCHLWRYGHGHSASVHYAREGEGRERGLGCQWTPHLKFK